jgi:hypothetical protein
MQRDKFKLKNDSYLLVEVSYIKRSREEGEEVHRILSKAKVYVSDTGTYEYSTVSCGLQSAVCTALDSLIHQLDEKVVDN